MSIGARAASGMWSTATPTPHPGQRRRARENSGMERQKVNPPALPAPRGFNHGILVRGGALLFLAGQDASDAEGRIVPPEDVVSQLEQVLRNLGAVVEAAGRTIRDNVQLNIFLRDPDDYPAQLNPLRPVLRG